MTHAQDIYPRFDSDLDIFFEVAQKHFRDKKVKTFYIAPVPDSFYTPVTSQHPDTVYYEIRRNGRLKAKVEQKLFHTGALIPFEGYDTTHYGINCRARYYCDCAPRHDYDSILCTKDGKVLYLRQATVSSRHYVYSANGLPVEQRMRDRSPDGSSTSKIIYHYDQKDRLVRMDFAMGQPGPNTPYPVTDIFRDFEFIVKASCLVNYNAAGLVSGIIIRTEGKNNERAPLFETKYIYERGMLREIRHYENGDRSITQKVGYKFY